MPLVGNTKWWHSGVVSTTQPLTTDDQSPVPFTSIYTPPTHCESMWKLSRTEELTVYQFDANSSVATSQMQTYDFVAYSTIALSLPKSGSIATTTSNAGIEHFEELRRLCQPSSYQQYYSPGVCPDKHTIAELTAWVSTIGTSSSFEIHYLASCCRIGISFDATRKSRNTPSCVGTITSPLRVLQPYTLTYPVPLDDGTETNSTSVFWLGLTSRRDSIGWILSTFENATTITQGLVVADPILVGWREKELPLFPTAYATSVANKAEMNWGSPTPAPASTSSLPKETNLPGSPTPKALGTGSKAGISVGVVGAVAIGALIIWLYLRRRRKQEEPQTAEIEGKPTPEMEDQDQELATRKWFLGGRWRNEVRAQEKSGELDSRAVNLVRGPPVEMDATERGDHRETEITPVV